MNSLCPWPPDPLTGHPLVDSSFSTYPCRTQESSGPLPAPSLLAVHIPHVSPVPVAWPPFHPGLLPKPKPCPARRGVAGVQSYLLKWQHQRSWALISPTPLPNQPPSPANFPFSLSQTRLLLSVSLQQPSASHQSITRYLLRTHNVKVLEVQGGPGPAIRSLSQHFSSFTMHTSLGGLVKMQILMLQV